MNDNETSLKEFHPLWWIPHLLLGMLLLLFGWAMIRMFQGNEELVRISTDGELKISPYAHVLGSLVGLAIPFFLWLKYLIKHPVLNYGVILAIGFYSYELISFPSWKTILPPIVEHGNNFASGPYSVSSGNWIIRYFQYDMLYTLCIMSIPISFFGAILFILAFPRSKSDAMCCEKCGYSLKGLSHMTCPECGYKNIKLSNT